MTTISVGETCRRSQISLCRNELLNCCYKELFGTNYFSNVAYVDLQMRDEIRIWVHNKKASVLVGTKGQVVEYFVPFHRIDNDQ